MTLHGLTCFWLRYQESGTHGLGNSSWLGWGWMLIGFLTFKCGTLELNLTQVLSWTEQQVSSYPIHRCHPGPTLFSWCVSFFKSFQGNGYSHPLKMCFELRRDTKNFPVHLKNLEGLNECLRRVYQNEWLRKVSNTLRSPRIPLPQCHKVILSQPRLQGHSPSSTFTRSCTLSFYTLRGLCSVLQLPRVCSLTIPSRCHFLPYSSLRT